MTLYRRLSGKARVLEHELRWRTGALPRWLSLPAPAGCRLLPDGLFLLAPEQVAAAARLLRAERPSAARTVIREADHVVAGKPHLWGRRVHGLGAWRTGLLQKGWPEEPFWRLELEGERAPGDVKLVWEPSRHVQFLTLARAYTLTASPHLVDAWSKQLMSWIDENPPWVGIHWSSPLEVAYRVITWCWSAAHFRGAPGLDEGFWTKLTAAVAAHLWHLDTHLTPRGREASNHRLGEGAGLLLGALALPTHPRALRWYERGLATHLEALARGLSSGVIWGESSAAYHFFALELAVIVWAALRAHEKTLPQTLRAHVASLLEGTQLLMPSPRCFLRWGDDDDYRLASPLLTSEERGSWAIESACRLLGEPLPWPWQGWHPVAPWVLGSELPPLPHHSTTDGVRVERELARCDAGHATVYLLGPQRGQGSVPGHAHADLLALCAFVGERPVVLDAGTFTYGGDPLWRQTFRSTAAHSAVVVDGKSQMRPAGRFGWQVDGDGEWERVSEAFGLVAISARHDAYKSLQVTHRRLMLLNPGGGIILRDELMGKGRHAVSQRFLMPPDAVTLAQETGGTPSLLAEGDVRLLLVASGSPKWDVNLGDREGWYSAAYGLKQPALMASRYVETKLPARMEVVLEPAGRTVRPIEGGALFTSPGRIDLAMIRPEAHGEIRVTLPSPAREVRCEAAACQLVLTDEGAPLEARLIDGRSLWLGSVQLFESSSVLGGVLVRWVDGRVNVASREPWDELLVAPELGVLISAGPPHALGDRFASTVDSA